MAWPSFMPYGASVFVSLVNAYMNGLSLSTGLQIHASWLVGKHDSSGQLRVEGVCSSVMAYPLEE
jgi:hypothetical protein